MLKRMWISIFVALFLVFLLMVATGFTAIVYDDFQKPNIDPNKWSTLELINEVQGGNLFSETVAYGTRGTNNLNFKNPTPINYIEADVTINKIEGDFGSTGINNYSSPNARITGFFYNDGSATGPGSYKGEVQGVIRISPYNGMYWVYWLIWKSTNDGGTDWSTLAWNWFPSPASLNTTYKLSIQFEPNSKTFTFKVGDTIRTWTSTDTIHPSNIPWKAIGTDVYFTGTGTELYGKISATFDNVFAKDESGNVVVSDDFSSPTIESDKWSFFIRGVSNGKLLSKVDTNTTTTNSRNSLEFKNPEQINNFQSKVALLDFKNSDGANTRARLGGHFYNDAGDPNSGYLGDVWAEVSIGGSGTDPSANWLIVRYTNAEGTSTTTLGEGQFPVSVNFGETYDLFLGWDGSNIYF